MRAEEYPEYDYRRNDPRYQGKNYDSNVGAAKIIANKKQVKPGQVALDWILHKGNDIVPIPGTKHQKYLEENVASDIIKLDTAEMNLLDDALAMGKVSGNRYPDWVMETIDR